MITKPSRSRASKYDSGYPESDSAFSLHSVQLKVKQAGTDEGGMKDFFTSPVLRGGAAANQAQIPGLVKTLGLLAKSPAYDAAIKLLAACPQIARGLPSLTVEVGSLALEHGMGWNMEWAGCFYGLWENAEFWCLLVASCVLQN